MTWKKACAKDLTNKKFATPPSLTLLFETLLSSVYQERGLLQHVLEAFPRTAQWTHIVHSKHAAGSNDLTN